MQPQVEAVVVEAEVVPKGADRDPYSGQNLCCDVDAAPYVVTGIISILDHDALH